MAHSYTPGLTVTETAVLRKRRLLPIPGTVTVETGNRVQADTVVARTELAGKVHVVNVANLLGAAPDEIRDYVLKKEGEAIGKDEVIAESKPLIKWFRTEVRSPIEGKLESVSLVTGQVLLREPPKALELLAYVDGTIVEHLPRQGVTVECTGSLIQGIFGIGGETWGQLAMAVQSPEDRLTPDRLNPSMKDQIVVGGSFLGADTMAKAREIGVAALVVGGIHDKDLRELLGYDLGVAITGTERVGFTLVITEGFGVIPMAAKTFNLLAAHVGQKASISGATQIRAGVIRPEIIIPKPAQPSAVSSARASADERTGIRAGDQVRIIRDPLFGRIGSVKSLPPDLRQIETESHVRVLEVGFADGSSTVIPRANVELIEG
ncbi:MAG: hypothetical protein KGO52_03785 [Nitrospirota bacterium]|nr:hypothetical protein [Nitrospirota bacterium]MDE3225332.1 hypothetical protein [Nitrospirota bacterium]MDE3241827.1 hypothetical protein [Nitrospirota bacterium]